ncbi:hypothetical protein ABPG74_001860 [Tetrahymena malaccensis]
MLRFLGSLCGLSQPSIWRTVFPEKLTSEQEREYEDTLKLEPTERLPNPLGNCKYPIENDIELFSIQFSEQKKTKLNTYRYPVKENVEKKAICIFFHGYNSHIGQSAHIAEYLSQHGIEVVGYDYRGFGKSDGLRGYVPQLDSHMKDAIQYFKIISDQNNGKYPIFVSGLSLGGLTSFQLSLDKQCQNQIKGMILFAPAIKDHPLYGKEFKLKLRVFGSIKPEKQIEPRKGYPVYRNMTVNEYLYNEDNLYYKGNTFIGSLKHLTEGQMIAEKQYDQIKVPFLLFMGGKDKLCDPRLANQLQKQSPSKDKTVVYRENMWHGIWLEPEIEEFKVTFKDWVLQRV